MMFALSPTMKEAVAQWAYTNNTSASDAARQALATLIGYDLANEERTAPDGRGRPKQYESKAARREAAKARRKAKRDLAKQLMSNLETEDARAQRAAFANAVASHSK